MGVLVWKSREQIVTRDKSLFTRTTLVTGSSETFCSVNEQLHYMYCRIFGTRDTFV